MNSKKELAIYGYGGHAREVAAQIGEKVTFFVDDEYVVKGTKSIKHFDPGKYLMMVAIADSALRKAVVEKLPVGTEFFSYIHETALVLDELTLGEGSFIGAHSILTTNIKIGKHAILNRGNHIGHDCRIGDYFSIMPGAILGGSVNIGNEVYVGSCANVREKINIVSKAIIGMNAAVVKNIIEPGTYVGVPAKKIRHKKLL